MSYPAASMNIQATPNCLFPYWANLLIICPPNKLPKLPQTALMAIAIDILDVGSYIYSLKANMMAPVDPLNSPKQMKPTQ